VLSFFSNQEHRISHELVPMIVSSVLLTACGQREPSPLESDAEIQAKLVGTWVREGTDSDGEYRTVNTISADGDYVAEGTFVVSNTARRFTESGTILFRGGVLTQTTTKHSNTNARLPMVERTRIVRLDGRELVLQAEERPAVSATFRKVNPECHFAGENQPRSCGSKPATPRCLSSYQFWFSDQALSLRAKPATGRAEIG